jgi:hypothetical protein
MGSILAPTALLGPNQIYAAATLKRVFARQDVLQHQMIINMRMKIFSRLTPPRNPLLTSPWMTVTKKKIIFKEPQTAKNDFPVARSLETPPDLQAHHPLVFSWLWHWRCSLCRICRC